MTKTKRIDLRVTEQEHKQYTELASKRGITLSKLIREILKKEVDKNE